MVIQPIHILTREGFYVMKKEIYIEPTMELVMFDVEDIMTVSSGGTGGGGGIVLPDDEW